MLITLNINVGESCSRETTHTFGSNNPRRGGKEMGQWGCDPFGMPLQEKGLIAFKVDVGESCGREATQTFGSKSPMKPNGRAWAVGLGHTWVAPTGNHSEPRSGELLARAAAKRPLRAPKARVAR